MEWFSGTLIQTCGNGWTVIHAWEGLSFKAACVIVERIREADPDAYFIYEPYSITI